MQIRTFRQRNSSLRSGNGAALILTLGAVVLISLMVLTFFSQTRLSRLASFSSAGQNRADLLAKSALNIIAGDLQTEIAAGSAIYTTNGVSIYIPNNNFCLVPSRVADNNITNILKKSAGTSNFWSGTSYNSAIISPKRAASGNSTDTASLNGRTISAQRWNASYLMGDSVPASFISPDWVLITRGGALTNATSQPVFSVLANSNKTNLNHVIGRYAYIIYNEGGLLDINIAGFPSSVDNAFKSKRGLLSQVDIGNIPGITNPNAIVQWRNQATALSANAYTNSILSNTNGFTKVASGDQAFVTRKDLIRFVTNNPAYADSRCLQYLGTFSRQLNAPSYTPDSSRAKVQSGNATYGYDNDFNPSLINLRNISTGKPLLSKRFPLSRLALVTKDATANSSSNIYKYFGLQRSSASQAWTYNHGNANRILRLAEVATEGRDPDFFELLQAGILVGSLGKTSGNSFSDVSTIDANTYYQIIQIGANLVDQYDSDSFPTRISFGSTEFRGIENLPYLNRVFDTAYRSKTDGDGWIRPYIGAWFQAEVWNPCALSTTPPTEPTQFRFVATGAAYGLFYQKDTPASNKSTSINTFPDPSSSPSIGIHFSTSPTQNFSQPTLLSPSNATASGDDNVAEANFIGLYIGTTTAPDSKSNSGTFTYNYFAARPQPLVNFQLQYWSGTDWITYSEIRNTKLWTACADNAGNSFGTYWPQVNRSIVDPTTARFGAWGSWSSPSYTSKESLRPNAGSGYDLKVGIVSAAGWTHAGSQSGYAALGAISDNLSTSITRYTDPDGVLRPADGAYSNGTSLEGHPMATGNLASRPVILNRPFRSVVEMGYASRDMPWKHLDFFSSASADAALLDLFCLQESADSTFIAGRVDINTRQQPVIKAVLQGAIKSEINNTVIATSEADTLALNLISRTTSASKGPLINPSELVTTWAPDLSYSNSADTIIKPQREAAIRAMADIGNCRTWNLMIDVIAQSGRYTTQSGNLNQFVVEGECRYWWHIAIDRFTNEIVDQFMEPVHEQ